MTKVYPTRNTPKYAAIQFDGTNQQEVIDAIGFGSPLFFTDQFDQLWIFDASEKKFLSSVQKDSWIVVGPYYGVEPFAWNGQFEILTDAQYHEKFTTSEA